MSEPTITARNPYRPEQIRARLGMGIGLSLLVHALILSLQFGIPGLALPGLELPWNKRHAQAPELTVQIEDMPAPPPAEPLAVSPPVDLPPPAPMTGGFTLVAPVKPPEPVAVAPTPPKPKPAAAVKKAGKPGRPPPLPREAETATAPPRVITRIDDSDDKFVVPVPSLEEPEKPAAVAQLSEPPVADISASKPAEDLSLQKQVAEAEARRLQEAQERKLADEAKRQAAALAAQKQDELKQAQRAQEMIALAASQQESNARRLAQENEARERQKAEQLAQEAVNQQAAALALQKQQEALQQQARQLAEADKARELLKMQLAREETARAQQLEIQRREELKRQEQLRLQVVQLAQQQERALKERQAMELEARKQAEELARQQAAAQARQKQLDELAARQRADELAARQQAEAASAAAQQRERDLAAQAGAAASSGTADGKPASGFTLPKSLLGSDLASRALDQAKKLDLLRGNPPLRRLDDEDKGRRRSILGGIKEDVPLRMYVDSWRQKIERNGNLNYSQIAKDKARGDPVVTVAIRSDGSVEEIIINRSSGRADIDEAVRRIIRVNARYSAFPPNIAAKYDVIEIRRVWNFDETLKILEEML
ncbi:energy transducer TonB [Undibacterium sp.]|uniref:energy transducer TonB n=1 Tax=Undibacterium sp. TaxID=1914977 RepID=UPI002CA31CA8|nr:energy transducer TonB [Undibacterium sp.]HTD04231.1 energy transducer TonB [Undibacterium sp.]